MYLVMEYTAELKLQWYTYVAIGVQQYRLSTKNTAIRTVG